jgi:hypothetical protein
VSSRLDITSSSCAPVFLDFRQTIYMAAILILFVRALHWFHTMLTNAFHVALSNFGFEDLAVQC